MKSIVMVCELFAFVVVIYFSSVCLRFGCVLIYDDYACGDGLLLVNVKYVIK